MAQAALEDALSQPSQNNGAILLGESFAPVLPSLCWLHCVCSAQRGSLHKLQEPWLLPAGRRQVTHLGLEALQPHDVLAAGGMLLPKVLPEGVHLQGELPLHLRRLQGDTSWSYPQIQSSHLLPRETCPDTTSAQAQFQQKL